MYQVLKSQKYKTNQSFQIPSNFLLLQFIPVAVDIEPVPPHPAAGEVC